MRLVPCLILLPSFAAISSLSQNVGSSSRPLPILEPLATFRDRWNTNDCRDLLSADVGGWRKCCVPLNSAEQVPSNCRSPTALKAKLSDQEDFDEQDFTKGWTVPAVETERLTETPSDALTASYHEPPISTEKRTASAVPAVGSTTGALLTGDILSQAPPVPTMLTAQLTTSIDSGAVTDDGYRAEGGSVTSTAPAGQLIASQFDGSPTDTLTSHTASEEFQTVLHPGDNPPPSDDILTISSDVYRHRAQSAVNLGFWFVAEQYGTPEFFRGCATNDTAEYNIAEGCAKEYMEDFWSSFITEKDFAVMAELGINTVRLPIGYWSVGKENCHCEKTPFWPFIDKYASQWSYVLKAIAWAAKYNIGVLVDFHAAEGSQNGWDHSGVHSRQPLFLTDPANMEHTTEILIWIAQQIKDMPNIVGLQLLNEPYPDTPEIIDPWYESTMAALKTILGDDFPFYVFGNNANRAAWVKRQTGFVVMDFHLYFLWNARIGAMTVEELISRMSTYYGPLLDSFGPNLIIGEWACTLSNPSTSWQDYTRFCDAQVALLNRASVAGWHYWSWKTEGNYNSTWSFLSSTGGSNGLRRAQSDQRELLIPPAHQPDFLIDTTVASGPAKNDLFEKRSLLALENPEALAIWEQGCETAQHFARFGSRLGFSRQWVRRWRLDTPQSEQEYHEHFSRGLQDCAST